MNLVHGRNHVITSKMTNIFTIKSHSKKLQIIPKTYSSSHQLNTTHKILNSKTATEALQIHQTLTSTTSLNPTKTLILHSATVHFLTNQRLYLKARCLIKCLIESLSKTCKPNRISSLLYNSLNNPEFVKPETKVFGVLVIALCEFGFLDEAYLVVKKSGNLPALHVCNRVLDGFLKMGNVEKMWLQTQQCIALINGYVKNGNMVKALEVCGEMVGHGVELNIITYSTLIDGYCKAKNMEGAMGLYTEMVIKGLVPDVVYLYSFN